MLHGASCSNGSPNAPNKPLAPFRHQGAAWPKSNCYKDYVRPTLTAILSSCPYLLSGDTASPSISLATHQAAAGAAGAPRSIIAIVAHSTRPVHCPLVIVSSMQEPLSKSYDAEAADSYDMLRR
eukprot:1160502-Pelagomonas_calceolata.AAC.3